MTEFMITLRDATDSDALATQSRYITFTDENSAETEPGVADWVRQLMAGATANAGDTELTSNGVGAARRGDVLFLIHGFNVNHQAAKAFHMKCAQHLISVGWCGQVVSFDWPSDGVTFAYLPDRANARASASRLVTDAIALLERTQATDCTIDVHVMAHSMGAFVLQQAFCWAYQDVSPSWQVAQVLLVAADVDTSAFDDGAIFSTAFAKYGGRLTAYCNGYDKALLASNAKRLELAPRMGRVGLPDDAPDTMCEVDCSDLFAKFDDDPDAMLSPVTTHCFYFDQEEFWQDAVLTLAGGLVPSRYPTRLPMPGTTTPNRYILNPDGTSPNDYSRALRRSSVSLAVGTCHPPSTPL
ncbi:alpha/beta fold hydrolase [Novosphingobium sp. FSW06-99]|uniref:alpha/beta fold hydrolase n=1 Tax=Novosphingobium sp. FSW06-99 TaxID=1739113 RepID=UPI00076DB07F|nr:alpha/beta fold hydrolase [Novosphingobium sp. FSW06-99]KUR74883.1 hypothetical protein AQZ49_16600 [Novosphingobium sp. FSW06-99]